MMKEAHEIIIGCQENKPECQRALMEAFSSKLMGVCIRYCKNRSDAEDVLQESWIRIFKSIGKYREEGKLFAWLKRICISTALRHEENLSRRMEIYPENTPSIQSLSMQIIEEMSAREIRELIDRLPRMQSLVFKLYVIEGYKHQEIAELTGISDSTSRVHLTQARNTLRQWIYKINKVVNL